MTTPSSRDLLRALSGKGEGKLRPVAMPTPLALIVEPLHEGSSRDRLAALVDAGKLQAATALLAYALPVREAVWWAFVSVGSAMPALPNDEREALAAAEAWVRLPGEDTRQRCFRGAKRVTGTAPAAVALGAFTACLSTQYSPLGNQWVQTALNRVLAINGIGDHDGILRCCIESGSDIAAGGAGRIAPRAGEVGST